MVEEWLSGLLTAPEMAFSQVNGYQNGAWVLPVKPSAKPTQVRTLDLPRESPGQRHRDAMASVALTLKGAVLTPLAVPVQRGRPRSWQVSGLVGALPGSQTADSR